MTARSNKYWRQLAERRMDEAIIKSDIISNKIGRAYFEALKKITERLETTYEKFPVGISEAEAKPLLKNVKGSNIIDRLEKAVGRIEDIEKKSLMLAAISTLKHRSKIDNLNILAENINTVCETLGGEMLSLMDSGLSGIATNTYYRSIYDTQVIICFDVEHSFVVVIIKIISAENVIFIIYTQPASKFP